MYKPELQDLCWIGYALIHGQICFKVYLRSLGVCSLMANVTQLQGWFCQHMTQESNDRSILSFLYFLFDTMSALTWHKWLNQGWFHVDSSLCLNFGFGCLIKALWLFSHTMYEPWGIFRYKTNFLARLSWLHLKIIPFHRWVDHPFCLKCLISHMLVKL